MREPATFEARLIAALSRYADQMPTDIDAHAFVQATGGGRSVPRTRFGQLRWRRAMRGVAAPMWLVLAILTLGAAVALAGALLLRAYSAESFPAGSIAFMQGGALSVASPDGRESMRVPRTDPFVGQAVGAMAFAPDRRHLAWTIENGQYLTIATPDGHAQASIPGCCYGFGWAPDGQRLAVFSNHQLAIVGIDGQRQRVLALPDGFDYDHFASDPHDMPWSPDGRWIAIRGCHTSYPNCKLDWDWMLVAADGSGAHWLHPDPADEDVTSYLAWAPDSTLALTFASRGSIQVQTADGVTLQEVLLPAGWIPTGPPDWSPDFTRLVLSAGQPQDGVTNAGGFAVIGLDGTSQVFGPLTVDSGIGNARWAVDGTHVLWTGEIDPSATPGMSLWSTEVIGESPPSQLLHGYIDAFNVARDRQH